MPHALREPGMEPGPWQWKRRVLTTGPAGNSHDWYPYNKRRLECTETPGMQVQRRNPMWGHSQKAATYKPRRVASEETKPDTLTSDFQPPELWENQFLLFTHPVCGILLWQPELSNTEMIFNMVVWGRQAHRVFLTISKQRLSFGTNLRCTSRDKPQTCWFED